MTVCEHCGASIETGKKAIDCQYQYIVAWNRFGEIEFFMPTKGLSDVEIGRRIYSMELRARFNSQRDIKAYMLGSNVEISEKVVSTKEMRELVQKRSVPIF